MRSHPLRHLLLAGLSLLSLAGCSTAAHATPGAGSGAPASAVPSIAAADATPGPAERTPLPDEPGKAWLLVGRPGDDHLRLILSTTGEVDDLAIPDGAPAVNWQRVVSARVDGTATVVRDDIVQPGFGGAELRLDGRWRLPTVGLEPVPAGRSLDGSTIILVEADADRSAARSRFAVLEHFSMGAVQTAGDAPFRVVRVVDLPGTFEYDALSPDGRILYVVQHLEPAAGGAYQVRAVDVDTGRLRDGAIVDKGNPDERMAGSPIAQIRRADGVTLTLYRGPEHPFIHLLNTKEAWAFCLDLPSGTGGDDSTGVGWGLAESPDGAAIYAVNAERGLVADVDPNGLAVRRTASLETTAVAPIRLAKFGHAPLGPVGRTVVASPDGSHLFAAGRDGITVIGTRDLTAIRHDLAGVAVDGLAMTPDGRTLFALRGDGRIVGLDAASGRELLIVPGGELDRLVAVGPW